MTLAVRVIPCLDVDSGRVVKGVNFQNLRDAGDPVEMAKVYDAEGADELTFLDITASSGNRETTYDELAKQMIRAVDGHRVDWTGQPGSPGHVERFWNNRPPPCWRSSSRGTPARRKPRHPSEEAGFPGR